MAPVVYMDNIENEFWNSMADDIDSITWWTDFFGINEFFGPNWIFTSGALCYIKDSWC
jgi:hypothetical protein